MKILRQPLIAFDLDDCLLDMKQAEKEWAYKHLGISPDDKVWEVVASNTPRQLGLTGEAYDEFLRAIGDAIISREIIANPKPHSLESIQELQKLRFRAVGLTGRKDIHWQGNAQLHAERQVKSVGINFDHVAACSDKGAWCAANGAILLVDDNPKFAEQVNSRDINSLLLTTNFNKEYRHDLNDHFLSWGDEFLAKVLPIITRDDDRR